MSERAFTLAAACVYVAAYVGLTLAGHDGNPVFVFAGGHGFSLAGKAVTKA